MQASLCHRTPVRPPRKLRKRMAWGLQMQVVNVLSARGSRDGNVRRRRWGHYMNRGSQFQFGIRRMLFLTAALAVICGFAVRLEIRVVYQVAILVYFSFFTLWAVIRLPSIREGMRQRSEEIERRRLELVEEAQRARRTAERRE